MNELHSGQEKTVRVQKESLKNEAELEGPLSTTGFAENPGPVLERLFEAIYRERMQGLPLVNTRIGVEALGFEVWEGHWLGILITPWFMNLLLIPRQGSPWPAFEMSRRKQEELVLRFPRGDYKFRVRHEEGIGSHLASSLASPVKEWQSHAELRQTALEVLQLLRTLPVTQLDESGEPESGCQLSRRAFLRGGSDAALARS